MAFDPGSAADAATKGKDESKNNDKSNTTDPIQDGTNGNNNNNNNSNNKDEYLLDMVFVLDCTGSMASYINSARDNIVKISKELSKLSEENGNENDKNDEKKNDSKNDNNNNNNTKDQIEGIPDNSAVPVAAAQPGAAPDAGAAAPAPAMLDTSAAPAAAAAAAAAAALAAPDAIAVAADDNKKEKKENNNNEDNNKDNKENNNDEKESKDDNNNTDNNSSNVKVTKKLSCQFAVVSYRDHPPQDTSFITQIRDFTQSSLMIEQYLSTLRASGGGDAPECLATALYDTLYNLKYRENSQKIVIIITDAPCHGIENGSGVTDGFPNGDPWPKYKLTNIKKGNNMVKNAITKKPLFGIKTRCKDSGNTNKKEELSKIENVSNDTKNDSKNGSKNDKTDENMLDILTLVRKISDDLQASFFTVACEPTLSTNYYYARDFMESVAEMSNGKFVPLAKANLLPKVIIASVKQQMIIDTLTEQIDNEIEILKLEYSKNGKLNELTEDFIAEFMEKKWENANIKYKEVAIGTLYRKERDRINIELLLDRQKCVTLKDFNKYKKELSRLSRNDFRHLDTKSKSKGKGLKTIKDKKIMNNKKNKNKNKNSKNSKKEEETEEAKTLVKRRNSMSDDSNNSLSSSDSEEEDDDGGVTENDDDDDDEWAEEYADMGTMMAAPEAGVEYESDDDDDGSDKGSGIDIRERDNEAGWDDSCSDDSQDVYEEIKPMDKSGVRKAVKRWIQTKD